MAETRLHKPVLLNEVLEQLAVKPSGTYIDATYGRGGHSQAILGQLNNDGRVLAIDRDPEAVASVPNHLLNDKRFMIEQASFADLALIAKKHELYGRVDGILLDLGVSSPQLDQPERGFSFLQKGPLDMRMDQNTGISVADWLHQASENDIASVLKEYGEERFSKRIARAIATERAQEKITDTHRLADIMTKAMPVKEKHKHPATRSFQALRIFINNELVALSQCLEQCLAVLATRGRLIVISFHSLEDRIVKRFIRDQARPKPISKRLPIDPVEFQPRLKRIGKAIKPTNTEIAQNPRARSAILRVAEKLV